MFKKKDLLNNINTYIIEYFNNNNSKLLYKNIIKDIISNNSFDILLQNKRNVENYLYYILKYEIDLRYLNEFHSINRVNLSIDKSCFYLINQYDDDIIEYETETDKIMNTLNLSNVNLYCNPY